MKPQAQEKVSTHSGRHERSLRCLCGSLLARLVPEGVELKCRRCKRRVVLPLEDERAEAQSRL